MKQKTERVMHYVEHCILVTDLDSGGDVQYPEYVMVDKAIADDDRAVRESLTRQMNKIMKESLILSGNGGEWNDLGPTGRELTYTIIREYSGERNPDLQFDNLARM